jgi:NAD(P)-dependent dehydrogenase (short-subunit alcohol dehydrogenase family)
MSYNPYSLERKTILVTGASSGIGKTTAIECSKMKAKLIITGRDEIRLKETYNQLQGIGHKYIIADLVSPKELEKLSTEVDNLDGLVLCAAKLVTSPIQFATPNKIKDVFDINFFSPVELLRLLFKKKKLVKDASVIFVSAVSGIIGFPVGNAMYGASKAAFSSIMKSCVKEFSVRGIRVNSVNPGMIETKMINAGTFTKEQREADIQRYPLKRYGKPEDVAYSIIFLLSDASNWITGLELVVDGGRTV